jgi:pimeloyl-ACP methyl ester carboxylesterase
MGGAADARIAAMGADERLQRLTALRPRWEDAALLPFPGGFLAPGPPAALTLAPARGGAVVSWASGYTPATPEVAADYAAHEANATATARWYGELDRPGPVVVAIHGYRGGGAWEPLLWPVRRWRRLGWSVALPALPFHGPRAGTSQHRPVFPAPDPRVTNEGFRQAVWDLTALLAALRARGHGPIHLAGMSLGGYTAALLATLVPDLGSLRLVVPLASLATFALEHGRFGEGPRALALRDALEAVYRPTSPLSRPSLLAPERVVVVGTRSDRITGPTHTRALAAHFGVTPLEVDGSHVLQHHLPWAELIP